MTQPKQENRGGARPGAGRKSNVYSDEFKQGLRDALDKKGKQEGRSFQETLVDLFYDKRLPPMFRASIAKIISGAMTIKESHQTIDKREVRAVVMLPPVQQAPARLIEGAGPMIDGETGEVLTDEKGTAA